MTDDSRSELSKAKISAFRFLKIRQRSVGEMCEKLAAKGIAKATVEETVAFLLEKKFLDDRQKWTRVDELKRERCL